MRFILHSRTRRKERIWPLDRTAAFRRSPVTPRHCGEGPLTTYCCHSRAEPNVALGSDGAARRPSNLIGAVPHQNFPGSHYRPPVSAARASALCVAPAPLTSLSGRSKFQSSIRDLIPRFETSQGFCRFRAVLPTEWAWFAAGAPNNGRINPA